MSIYSSSWPFATAFL